MVHAPDGIRSAAKTIQRTSAADLKSLHRKRRNEPRDFKSKRGTRITNLLVPIAIRSSKKVIAEMVYELRKVDTRLGNCCDPPEFRADFASFNRVAGGFGPAKSSWARAGFMECSIME